LPFFGGSISFSSSSSSSSSEDDDEGNVSTVSFAFFSC
jgi:hypothetical protein